MNATALPESRLHWPCPVTATIIMLAATVYPVFMAKASGAADHGLATALFWAMSAGFVRGVGFVPERAVWRWLFSGWSCLAGLALAAAIGAAR